MARLLAELRNWFGREEPSDASLLTSVQRLIEDPSVEYLLGASREGEDPVGVCQLRFRWGVWHSAEDCWLEDLFVREQARGCGVGAALGRAAIARARERGCARVELDVSETNRTALTVYEGLGFSSESGRAGERNLLMRLPLGRFSP